MARRNFKEPKVYINDWLAFHPYKSPIQSDFFYLKLCNQVGDILKQYDPLYTDCAEGIDYRQLSCSLVAYFEDIVSDIGIWKAFTTRHHELCGKYLPFYDLTDYFENEINPQDISFLVWYYYSMIFAEDGPVFPTPQVRLDIGQKVYELFDKHWDQAPVNQKLKEFISISHDEDDFYKVRFIYDWLGLNSYLFFYHGYERDDNINEAIEMLERHNITDPVLSRSVLSGAHDDIVNSTITRLLAMRPPHWLAYVLGGDHPLYRPLLEMDGKKSAKFLYLGENDTALKFKHLASGKFFDVTKKSLTAKSLGANKSVAFFGLIKWMDEWWFSGAMQIGKLNDNVLLEETADPVKGSLFSSVELKKKLTEEQYGYFLEFNNGSPLKFLPDAEAMNKFVADWFVFYNEKAEEQNIKDGKTDTLKRDKAPNYSTPKSPDDDEPRILFFNRETGVEIIMGYSHLIPDKNNPSFDKDYDPLDMVDIFTSEVIGHQLTKYLIETYNIYSMMDEDDEDTNTMFRNECDFLMRFYKPQSYHQEPTITLLE